VKNNFFVISDEVYEKLVYDGREHFSIASFGPEIYEKTITVNAFSKAYAMTGWRVGYTASSEKLAGIIANLQSQTTSGTCSIAQWAGLEALNGPQDSVGKMAAAFDERRKYVMERVAGMEGLEMARPEGAFYAFIRAGKLCGKKAGGRKINNGDDFCAALLDAEKVLLVPGSPFGAPDYARLSYASSMESLKEGLDRIERFVKGLK
jgi:aspartate aminotransferase